MAERTISREQINEDLRMISDYTELYRDEFATREILNYEADKGISDTTNPASSVQKVANQILWIAREKIKQQMALHTFSIKGGRAGSQKRALIQAAWERYLFLAGYKNVFEDNDNMLGTGDQFVSFGANPDYVERGRGFIFQVRSENITKVCFPEYCTVLRKNGSKSEVRRCGIIREYRENEIKNIAPWLDEEDYGELPASLVDNADQKQSLSSEKKDAEKDKKCQIVEIIDIDRERRYFIGGKNAKVSPVVDVGEDFPYRTRNEENYINLVHRFCLKLSRGVLNAGIFHAVYKIGVLDRMLQNAGLTFELNNINQIKIVRADMSATDFEKKLSDAFLAQQQLREGVIYIKSKESLDIGSIKNPPLINELFSCITLLERDLGRIGIKLDDAISDPAKTAFAIDKEIEAFTQFARFRQKQNVNEVQAFHDYSWDWMIQNVPDDCDIDLGLVARIRNSRGEMVEVSGFTTTDENGQDQFVPLTVGDLAKAAREDNYIVVVNPESGVVNPKSYQRNLRRYRIELLQQFGVSDALLEEYAALGELDGETIDLDFLKRGLKQSVAAQGGVKTNPRAVNQMPESELTPVEG